MDKLKDEDLIWIGKMVVEKKTNVHFSLEEIQAHLDTKNEHTAQLEVQASGNKRKIDWQTEYIKKKETEIEQLKKKLKESVEQLNAEKQFDSDLLSSSVNEEGEEAEEADE